MNSRERYDAAVGDFIAWFISAARLRDAANLVLAGIPEKDRSPRYDVPEGYLAANSVPDLRGVYLYLASLSIENLLKGFWVQANEHEYKNGKHPKAIKGHELGKLAMLANVTFDATEKSFVDLSRQAESLGRYPGPLDDSQDLVLPDEADINKMTMVFEALYERLRDELMKDVEPG